VSFLKFSRDRRGYENFYLVEPVTGRRGKTRQRVLYWYRTPPNVKVGREPFDAHVMRALEAQYPGVKFDWDQLRHTPIPSVEPEYWRERRRAERAVRRQQEDEDAETVAAEPPAPEPVVIELLPEDLAERPGTDRGPEVPVVVLQGAADSQDSASPGAGPEGSGARRRRRRRRGQRSSAASVPSAPGAPHQTESSTAASIDGNEGTDDGPVDSSDD
jgi:hypothetical protein